MLSFVALFSLAGILSVWGIYPLVIVALAALVARRKGVASIVEAGEPAVSVIIATRDDVEATRRRIADCLQTSYDPARVQVVVAIDRNSGAVTGQLGPMDARVAVVEGDRPGGKAATLNAAGRAATDEILVFGDVYQRFQPDAIGHLVAALGAPIVGAVSGCLEIPKTNAPRSLAERYWLYERRPPRSEAVVHSSVGVTGAIWAMRRSLWSPFPPGLILDDVYAPMQVVLRGSRVGFVQSARAIETRRHDAAQEYRRKVTTLTGVIQVCAWLPQVLNPIRNPIWLQFTIHKLLRFLTPTGSRRSRAGRQSPPVGSRGELVGHRDPRGDRDDRGPIYEAERAQACGRNRRFGGASPDGRNRGRRQRFSRRLECLAQLDRLAQVKAGEA